ncbi:multidrug effflux MFS transporter [Reinekea thalattae]|uniref:Bcr/CflA family efflux transporter n=1 Tax=Reinekea thalattae TaxID=2593301 RepID=A0A5C8ZCJ6_9GAMM|nr:multidrug effflux MFS transporter [Reinekea thalattae]TXR54570.1 multidrug effflux MFS transporter [Reinekea thalattae]
MTTLSSSSLKKALSLPEFIVLTALITSLMALSTDSMLAALPDIAADLKVVDYRNTQWIISLIILGMSFGQLIFGPVSDAYGRKFSLAVGTVIFVIGGSIAMLAHSLPMMLLGRLIQGIGAAGPIISSRATVRDQYVGDKMAKVMSFVMLVFILVPMLAPLIGQIIMYAFGWRAIFGALILLCLGSSLWFLLRQPETLEKIDRRPLSLSTVLQTSLVVLKKRVVLAYTFAIGCVFSVVIAYISSAQRIFQEIYLLGDLMPYYFGALSLGIGGASFFNGMVVERIGARKVSSLALMGLLLTPLLMLPFALLNGGSPPLLVFMVLGFAMFFCLGLLFGNLNALAMVPLGKMAGIGSAIIGCVSNTVGVILGGIIAWLFNGTLLPFLLGVASCASLGLVILYSVRNHEIVAE